MIPLPRMPKIIDETRRRAEQTRYVVSRSQISMADTAVRIARARARYARTIYALHATTLPEQQSAFM